MSLSLQSDVVIANFLTTKAFFIKQKPSTSSTTDLWPSIPNKIINFWFFQLNEKAERYSTQMSNKPLLQFQGDT